MNPISDIRSLFSYIRVIRAAKPDVMLAYTVKAVIYGCIAAKICRVQKSFALITGLGFIFQQRPELAYRMAAGIARWLYRIGLSGVTCAIFQNPDDERELRKLGILSDAIPSVVVRGSGVDCEYYAPQPLPEGLRFLMIARLLKQKGVREYVEAAGVIKQRHPEVSFALLGWQDENPDAVNSAELESWNREGFVEFLDRSDDVRPYIADSNVYVLPSYREGTPRTVLEAMAMARPIVTTNVPGCRETVRDGENGFLVDAGSTSSLVDALLKFVTNRGLINSMGRRSREIAEELYEVGKVNSKMLEVMGLTEQTGFDRDAAIRDLQV